MSSIAKMPYLNWQYQMSSEDCAKIIDISNWIFQKNEEIFCHMSYAKLFTRCLDVYFKIFFLKIMDYAAKKSNSTSLHT